MLTSMTGFGRSEVSLRPAGRAVVEVHTLNHRFLEMDCRLPEEFQSFDAEIRAMVGRDIHRGRVRISVVLKSREPKTSVVFHSVVARQYVTQLQNLQKQLRIAGPVTLEMVLNLPQVMTGSGPDALPIRWWPQLKKGIMEALAGAVKMRKKEGEHLTKVLDRLVRLLEDLQSRIRRRVPIVQKDLEKKLAARIRDVALGGTRASALARTGALDWKMVVAEAASLVQATDVSEELDRVDSHLATLHQAVGGQIENPGRTVDFLAQELHREVNTLGAKLRDGTVVRWVVAMKGQIERLREQAANVE